MATKKKQSAKKQNTQDEVKLGTAISSIELFFQDKKNQNRVFITTIVILVIVFGIVALNRWYLQPLKAEAKAQMFPAEQLFMEGDYVTALNGDGNVMGFAEIAHQYGNKAGKIIHFYKGICQLKTGDNEGAIKSLKEYSGKEKIAKARAYCCIADAYVNLDDNAEALKWYKKAIAVDSNTYTAGYLLKAGIICEEMGDNEQALHFYDEISVKHPNTLEAYEVGKYISRLKNN
ncbi:MAG: tetratricopeptide repeat protein [Bacteroidales bacterium]|jgi:tetratricopeptide (TPR) repeat protein|nr:tetratricopeptide repeat protein [Bacteroidales bacterium]